MRQVEGVLASRAANTDALGRNTGLVELEAGIAFRTGDDHE